MASETTVAVFDTAAHAEAAIADLVAQGVPANSIEHYAQSRESAGGAATTTSQHRGLWAWLTGESETTSDHHAFYDKTIETGGIVVTVISDDSQAVRIHTILEAHDPIDLDERHSQYSASDGYGTGVATGTAGATEVLTLSAESLQVGKRAVDKGVTRVRRYVVERPVEEQIRLRDETVTVFRRPVTAETTVGADAFTDRVITAQGTAEEAVVAKSARVVEEVVVQRDVAERVETVRDSLRHEEVEIGTPTVQTAADTRLAGV